MQFVSNGGAFVMHSATLAECDFTPVANPTTTVVSGSSSGQVTVKDTVFDQFTSASTTTSATITIQNNNAGGILPTFSVHPEDTGIASVDTNSGVVTRISDGTARINCTTRYVTKQVDVTCSSASSATTNSFNHYVSGSLAEHCAANVDSLASATGKSINLFSTWNTSSAIPPVFVRNTNCWAASIDTSAIAVGTYNPTVSGPYMRHGGTLVTPRHILMANHANYTLGSTIWFVDNSNNLISKTLVSATQYLSTWTWNDVLIGTLDSDVVGITPLKTMPTPFTQYFGLNTDWYSVNTSPGVPGIYTCLVHSGVKQIGIFELGTAQALSYNDSGHTSLNSVDDAGNSPTTTARQQYNPPVITGDSGNPMLLLIGSPTPQLVVLGPMWAPQGCTDLPSCVSAINSDIAGTGHSIGTVDLGGFPTY